MEEQASAWVGRRGLGALRLQRRSMSGGGRMNGAVRRRTAAAASDKTRNSSIDNR